MTTIDKCPIHPTQALQISVEFQEKAGKDRVLGWCPQCQQKFPVGLPYPELLATLIRMQQSRDSIAEYCQSYEIACGILESKIIGILDSAEEQLKRLWERIDKERVFWTVMGDLFYATMRADIAGGLIHAFSQEDMDDLADLFPRLRKRCEDL